MRKIVNMKHLIALSLAALLMATPATMMAREKKNKQNKKMSKQEVVVDQNIPVTQSPVAVAITDPATQLRGEWNIETLRNKPLTTRQRAYLYLDFDNNRVYGNNGCNSINGEFRMRGRELVFSDLLTTDNTCHSNSNERNIMKALEEVRKVQVTTLYNIYYMYLLNSKGQAVMMLKSQNIDFMNGAWAVKEMNNENVSEHNLRLVIDTPMRTVHCNTGENIINGLITVDPAKDFAIQFEDLVSSGYEGENVDLETSLLIALEMAETCKRINAREVALLDGKGNMVLVLDKLELHR